MVNFTDGCEPGQGLCENMARYSRVPLSKRKEFGLKADRKGQDMDSTMDDGAGCDDMSILSAEEVQEGSTGGEMKKRVYRRKLHWKTEYLAHYFYVHAGLNMRRGATLFRIGITLMHDIVYAWANFLMSAWRSSFPRQRGARCSVRIPRVF